ncbi:hypothetical protein D3C76_1424390 [compost metagenome]
MRKGKGLRFGRFKGGQVTLTIVFQELHLHVLLIAARLRYLGDLRNLRPVGDLLQGAFAATGREEAHVGGIDGTDGDTGIHLGSDLGHQAVDQAPTGAYHHDVTHFQSVAGGHGKYGAVSIADCGSNYAWCCWRASKYGGAIW